MGLTGGWIRERRLRLGLSQIELARRVGTRNSRLSKWENGWEPVPESFVAGFLRELGGERSQPAPLSSPPNIEAARKSWPAPASAPPKAATMSAIPKCEPESPVNDIESSPALVAIQQTPILPKRFFARVAIRDAVSRWYDESGGFPTYVGARVTPLAHQIFAATRVLRSSRMRFLLGDEAGLGKTVEAGLVLQALWSTAPSLNALVVTPGALVHQWRRELSSKFGGREFSVIDAGALSASTRSLGRGAGQVASMSALAVSPTLLVEVAKVRWGALIIDEAHRIGRQSKLFRTLEEISAHAQCVLALTALPTRGDLEGVAGLLRLIEPSDELPRDSDRFRAEFERREATWAALDRFSRLLEDADASPEDLDDPEIVEAVFAGFDEHLQRDPLIAPHLDAARRATGSASLDRFRKAYAIARDRRSLNHRIVRTSRRIAGRFGALAASRVLLAEIRFEPSAGEADAHARILQSPQAQTEDQMAWVEIVHRVACRSPDELLRVLRVRTASLEHGLEPTIATAAVLGSDPGPGDEEWLFSAAARSCPELEATGTGTKEVEWLSALQAAALAWQHSDRGGLARNRAALAWMAGATRDDSTRTFLVFGQSRNCVELFARDAENAGFTVRAIHHDLNEELIDRAANDFVSRRANVLVTDDSAAEGRNFQSVWGAVHLDVPSSPFRIEQRIGRLDRIGRPAGEPVRTICVFSAEGREAKLHDIQKSLFGVHESSIAELEFHLPELERAIRAATFGPAELFGPARDRLEARLSVLRADADRSHQLAIDTTEAELRSYGERVTRLREVPSAEDASALAGWFEAMGATVRPEGSGVKVFFSNRTPAVELRGVERRKMCQVGTFRRSGALANETLPFLAVGHQLVDSAIGALDQCEEGRAAMIRRRIPNKRGSLFAVALFVGSVPELDDSVPLGLATRARTTIGRPTSTVCLELDREACVWRRVLDRAVVELLIRPYDEKQSYDLNQSGSKTTSEGEWQSLLVALGTTDLVHPQAHAFERFVEQELRLAELDTSDPTSQNERRRVLVKMLGAPRQLQMELDALALIEGAWNG
ncbi:MAG: helix-turn-helix domain-containing protein [Deltaproteobacteria bacterium]|nr:helix-turn-helix domain-containing protein [Deltaproteobacteria bacterium]